MFRNSSGKWVLYILIFFFFLMATPAAYEVPKPGVELELQLWPTPQPWQHWIPAPSVTTPQLAATPDPFFFF